MKVIDSLRQFFTGCFSANKATTTASSYSAPITIKNRLSSTLNDLFNFKELHQEEEDQDMSLIDAAASSLNHPPSPSHRSTIIGTIYGHRRGHVTFCFQSDPTAPPPFLFELSVPTQLLAKEMDSGLLRIALECHRLPHHLLPSSIDHSSSTMWSLTTSPVWKAYCNGRKVGYAVRRKPTEKDKMILQTVRTMSAGAGVLLLFGGDDEKEKEKENSSDEGELLYMRATYERVVGSRDSVSYHMMNPGGGSSDAQDLSVFLLRTG